MVVELTPRVIQNRHFIPGVIRRKGKSNFHQISLSLFCIFTDKSQKSCRTCYARIVLLSVTRDRSPSLSRPFSAVSRTLASSHTASARRPCQPPLPPCRTSWPRCLSTLRRRFPTVFHHTPPHPAPVATSSTKWTAAHRKATIKTTIAARTLYEEGFSVEHKKKSRRGQSLPRRGHILETIWTHYVTRPEVAHRTWRCQRCS